MNDSGKADIIEIFQNSKLYRRVDFFKKQVFSSSESFMESVFTNDLYDLRNLNSSSIDRPARYRDGDIQGWQGYISQNIRTPARFMKIFGPGIKTWVGVEFKIDVTGHVSTVFIYQSREWSIDMEAIRIFKNSSLWNPAMASGKKVPYTHRQRVTFQVNE
jgi:hypothetical protein